MVNLARLFIFTVCLCAAVFCIACTGDGGSKFIGKWEGEVNIGNAFNPTYTILFYETILNGSTNARSDIMINLLFPELPMLGQVVR